MKKTSTHYQLAAENIYCSTPDKCQNVAVLFVGAGIGLSLIPYLINRLEQSIGNTVEVAIADSGPLDLITHVGNTLYDRYPFVCEGTERIGGKLALWGHQSSRPAENLLRQWPYPFEDLAKRFETIEIEMGIPETIPKSNRYLEAHLLNLFRDQFSWPVKPHPLAIDSDGHRWSPLDYIPELKQKGVHLLPHFHCIGFDMDNETITNVKGIWVDGKTYSLRPKIVILGIGVENTIELLQQVQNKSIHFETSDHIRIDCHGELSKDHFGVKTNEELGIAMLLAECMSKNNIPFRLAIKVAPKEFWLQGYMPSWDNLRNGDSSSIWCQVQAIGCMHDRYPNLDMLNFPETLRPVMSWRDAELHAKL